MNLNSGILGLGAIETKKLAVWSKGATIFQNGVHHDPAIWRHDAHGNVIRYSDYGDRNSKYGWEFDHYPLPASLGGNDDLSNLRPLHYAANASHGGILGGLLNQ
ncbi:MAG TPA: hypothetical protein VHZ32_18125 [Rhizomicrobium sp.]|jgi:hypothetical protein|nr:hypothetical protein [Rhizomicrobium sp.]